MRYIIILVSLALFLAGCSQNLNLLLRLDKENKAINRQLKLQEGKFELLLADIERGSIKQGLTKKYIIARYGEPILEIPLEGRVGLMKLLYRRPLEYFNTTKVYLYFDSSEKLLKWDVIVRDSG
ncbi:MAG: hypothetical protein KJ593_01055 [Candidatus Omnitrophica bacterium]|nr:hypothetical protein [Candidatus Omnitrophota bacterium]